VTVGGSPSGTRGLFANDSIQLIIVHAVQVCERLDTMMSQSQKGRLSRNNLRAIRPPRVGNNLSTDADQHKSGPAAKFSCDLDGTKIKRELPQHRRRNCSDLSRVLTAANLW